MILGFTLLLLCQLIGEVLAYGLALPVPGPVIGLVILAFGLHVVQRRKRGKPDDLDTMPVTRVADGLLANLSVLFVPAGVGVIDQLGLLRAQALALGASVLVSTALTLLTTVLVFVGVKRLLGPPAPQAAE